MQLKALIKYINNLTKRGLPPINAIVCNFGGQIAKKNPGEYWVTH